MTTPPIQSDWPATVRDRVAADWRRLIEADTRYGDLPGPLRQRLGRAIAISEFAFDYCLRHPDELMALWRTGRLERGYDLAGLARSVDEDFKTVADETSLLRRLRQTRNREMFLLAWRDLHQLSTVEQTLAGLSALADALVDIALRWLYEDQCRRPCGIPRDEQGVRQSLVVLGMGKLGGQELNFSSDIDLIFFFPARGMTDGQRPISNERFFTRLGQRLIRALDSRTSDGFVFRVDMRLRPFGKSGALTPSMAAMLQYYPLHGRDWERYAMIKARVIAGDRGAGERLLDELQGFVYRRYLDYSAIESLRDMKAMIEREAARKSRGDHLKLGPGGIREVEFIVQLFQLIHGGRDRHLRQRSLLPVLHYLGERGLLPKASVEKLARAYRFLRKAENALQMLRDQQTHVLPENDDDRWRLAAATGFERWEHFRAELDHHRQIVRDHFETLFRPANGEPAPAPDASPLRIVWETLDEDRDANLDLLREAGFRDPEATLKALIELHDDRRIAALSSEGRRRLDRLMPRVLDAAARQADPDETLARLSALIAAIAQRTVYLSLLLERPQALEHLARLCAASPWFRDYISRHPLLLDSLIDPRTLYAPPDREALRAELDEELARLDPDDEEQFLDQLRHFKKRQVFRVAAADIVGALPLMKVSDHLTWLAEVLLEAAAEAAWNTLTARFGAPRCVIEGQPHEPRLMIIGYGKLGGLEMGYGSDLDLVFVHDSAGEQQATDGENSIHNEVFFARLGQRIIHLLTVMTPARKVYETDLRLRPGGQSGRLVPSFNAYARYLEQDAWTWEHQALIRARPITGPAPLRERFAALRERVLCQPRDPETLRDEVRAMRQKMWRHQGQGHSNRFDLKKSPGGIVDLEFIVQYLVLANAARHPEITRWTDNIRILDSLAAHQILDESRAEALSGAYRRLRDEIHRRTLNNQPPEVDDREFAQARQLIRDCWRQFFG
ncbi:MAG TPA: bifunctional [glutamate--ammonia ligase]-adenylyl-L-tyrosine phosphorylase/[glutamate--ammonia-ligase] adenylyltransferase [Gammaproteobacteria bacterium]|nr:bifunctional [glutamate--ammonia ligase]-adenylyl-L-tyrosine phosphorylase/[glutamate--ammonia-ligase] adenylyltransferase [Gammaproteobacteria bacterium]